MSRPRGAKLPQVDGARAWQWLEQLAAITEPERPWTRCAFTSWHAQGRAWLRERFVEAGLAVRVDAAGNLIGRREGRVPGAPVLMRLPLRSSRDLMLSLPSWTAIARPALK